MKEYFGDIAKDIEASSYAYECLKIINKIVPEGSGEEYYSPLKNLLKALNENIIPLAQIKIWSGLKILDNLGSSPNFMTDQKGDKLLTGSKFEYDFDKHCFFISPNGFYGPNHVKVLRHLTKTTGPIEVKGAQNKLIKEVEDLVALILKTHTD
jgi:hypothetical protein